MQLNCAGIIIHGCSNASNTVIHYTCAFPALIFQMSAEKTQETEIPWLEPP